MAIDDSDHHNSTITAFTVIAILLLLATTAAAQPTSGVGSDPTDSYPYNPKFSPSMGIIIIILVIALFFMGFFSMYLRHCTDGTINSSSNLLITTTARSRRSGGLHQRGLDPELIASFPTFVYVDVKTLKVGNGALECAVCLNEFEDDETLSLIPNCDHVFHPECIGAWLLEHVTCPVCRADLTKTRSVAAAGEEVEDKMGQSVRLNGDSTDITNSDVGENDESILEMPLRSAEVVELGQRMNRNRTRRIQSGRPRFYGRMNSTGHVAVKQWENLDRFTLRLPVEVRKQVMSGKLTRSTSCVVLGSGSTRRGVNQAAGPGREGSVRGGGWSDRWSGFLSRWNSMRSIRGGGGGGWSMRSREDSVHSLRGDVAMGSAVDHGLPPV